VGNPDEFFDDAQQVEDVEDDEGDDLRRFDVSEPRPVPAPLLDQLLAGADEALNQAFCRRSQQERLRVATPR